MAQEDGQARSRLLDLTAGWVEILHWGDAAPVALLLPGASGGIRGYHDLGAGLCARGVATIGMNPRSCGHSTGTLADLTWQDLARDVAEVIDAAMRAPVLLIGHAAGNRIARLVATLRPDLVRGLVLLAAGAEVPPDPTAQAAMTALWSGQVADPDERRRLTHQAFFAAASVIPDGYGDVPDRSRDLARAIAAAPPPDIDWQAGGTGRMLVLQGAEDRIAPPANGHALRARYPHRVQVVDLDHAAHALCTEKPDEIAGLITQFLLDLGSP